MSVVNVEVEGMLGMVQMRDAQVSAPPLFFIFFCAAPKVDVPPLLPTAVLSRESMMADEGLAGTDVQHDHLVAVAGRSAASLPYEHHVERLHASVCFASL